MKPPTNAGGLGGSPDKLSRYPRGIGAILGYFYLNRHLLAVNRCPTVGVENLSVGVENLSVGVENLSIGVENLSIGVENLSVGVENLSVGVENLSVGVENRSWPVGGVVKSSCTRIRRLGEIMRINRF